MTIIQIRYGPYEAYGIIKHRFHKLRGLYESLSSLGHEIELVEMNLLNRLSIEMCRRKIFSCDIRNLAFNMDSEDDMVCQRAVFAVEEAYMRFDADENVPRHTSISKGVRQIDELQNIQNTQELIYPELLYEVPYRWGTSQ